MEPIINEIVSENPIKILNGVINSKEHNTPFMIIKKTLNKSILDVNSKYDDKISKFIKSMSFETFHEWLQLTTKLIISKTNTYI